MKSLKKYKKHLLSEGILVGLSCYYLYQLAQFFKDVRELLTVGARFDINVLEMAYYRSDKLTVLFISYFLLVSGHLLTLIATNYTVRLTGDTEDRFLVYIFGGLTALFIVLSSMNRIWPLFLVSTLVVLAITYGVQKITDHTYKYELGEIIKEQSGFITEQEASDYAERYIKEQNQREYKAARLCLNYYILEIGDTYSVDIYLDEMI